MPIGDSMDLEKADDAISAATQIPVTELVVEAGSGGVSEIVNGKASEAVIVEECKEDEGEYGSGDGSEDDDQWSLYDEMFSQEIGIGGSDIRDLDICSPEESKAYRAQLRVLGTDDFIRENLSCGKISAKKLITAFGIYPPSFLEGQPDEGYYSLLGFAVCRELSKRQKLPDYNTIEDAVSLLQRSRNIIVLTGAGISTSLGIPDFRSKDTGLYAQLQHLGLSDPQEVFEIGLFREDPTIFYSVAKDILPSTTSFSPTHAFIRLLQDRNQLLTNFTQNIDNLEGHAGILPEKLIQCHGSFARATCIECKYNVAGDTLHNDIRAGKVPECSQCLARIRAAKPGQKRKRISNGSAKSRTTRKPWDEDGNDDDDEEDDIAVSGVMKPDITFFGEDLPDAFHKRLLDHDREKVDLVLVIGTSLKVAPVSEVVGIIPSTIPQIYVSREPCLHVDFDIEILGDCDTIVAELCRQAGWELKHEMNKSASVTIEQHERHASRYTMTTKSE